MKKYLLILLTIFLLAIINTTIAIAENTSISVQTLAYDSQSSESDGSTEEEEEERDCFPYEGFNKYSYAEPKVFMPNLGESTTLYWNFQCTHESVKIDLKQDDSIIDVINSSKAFTKGGHQYTWNGMIDGSFAPNGSYEIVLTPQDEYSNYPTAIDLEVYNFKYKSFIDIYGQEIVENIRGEIGGE